MSWQTQLAQTYGNMTDWIEDTVNGINKVLTDAGWTVHDAISETSGETDRVYKSTGEDGTESIYVRLIQVSTTQKLRFRLYTFWNNSTHVGYNEVKNDDDYPMTIECLDTSFTGWIVANKNGLTLAWRQNSSTEYNLCYVGIPETRVVPANKAGRTTLSSGVTVAASGSTALSVGSSSNIQVGQKVFVINQTAGANAGNLLRCTVTATGTGSITVTNDAATATAFDSGALVGYDPMPTMFFGLSWQRSSYMGAAPGKGALFIYGFNTTRMTGTAIALASQKQYAVMSSQGHVFLAGLNTAGPGEIWSNEAWWRQDPDVNGNYCVYPAVLIGARSNDTDNTDELVRASTTRLALVTRGSALAQLDEIQVGTTKWICFFQSSTYTDYSSNFCFKSVE